MIHEVMSALQDAIEDYFRGRFDAMDGKILLSGLVDQEGKPLAFEEDNVVITLVNIEREQVLGRSRGLVADGENIPFHLKIWLLFSVPSVEGNYEEALKLISGLISFFQANQSIPGADLGLPSNIEKLTFEYHAEELLGMSNMWGMHGGRYLPSALFKVRIVTFNEDFSAPTGRVKGLGAKIF
ncbi:Pvc16 family protein [Persicobacter diffluens]|uniref:Pvc16 N-terminal domain-containing protein n=1 Tax=Persicobacter diffluens TaxID=981 RepID=A0AAN4W0H4_9BACT|nr:hypothetical protein PEDI_39860 [Persicobacter diffluens]